MVIDVLKEDDLYHVIQGSIISIISGDEKILHDRVHFNYEYASVMFLQFDGMMASSNGNIFRVTSHLCGEFTGQWRGALMFSLICARINDWVNNREAGNLRRRRAHHDITVMGSWPSTGNQQWRRRGHAQCEQPGWAGSCIVSLFRQTVSNHDDVMPMMPLNTLRISDFLWREPRVTPQRISNIEPCC